MKKLYYEDVDVGEVYEVGSFTAKRSEQLEFAEQWHPQLLQSGEDVAADTLQDDMIANGWYLASSCMRLLVDNLLDEAAMLGSFGLDEVRWPNPVQPEAVVNVECLVTNKTASNSHEDRGYIEFEVTGTNEKEDEVVFWRATSIFSRK